MFMLIVITILSHIYMILRVITVKTTSDTPKNTTNKDRTLKSVLVTHKKTKKEKQK